ncbi:MAG: hypothetical protein HQ595_01830 [Candidatus Omnitrophica bacterium]|nr:hypothetical protein [Candidatus Omnitrophota bacterium]
MSAFRRQKPKEQLGQVLLQRGVITQAQLDEALQMQQKQGGLLGELLTGLGFTKEEEIAQALAIQHDFPYLPLASYEIDTEIVKLVPQELTRKYCVLPIDKMGDILTVVMANPLDSEAIEQLEAASNCKIEVFVATHTEIKKAIEDFYATEQGQDVEGKENA